MGGSSRRSSSQSLPFSKSKPKTHKRRRHQQLRDLLFTNLFSIFIFFSFIFLLFIILNYGIPKPGSSKLFNSKSNAVSRPKRSLQRKPISQNSLFSSVDITTKSLYDKIDFLDLDGGAWKQGWEVKYKGDEWDDEKLKVFVVPHSHNDPGWKLTVEEYYQRQSRHILDTIVETLSKDARRKFIWEEMSYLQRWWRDAKGSKREDFVNLVKNGQLEIVGGGWVMNDEANSHYYAIIEQMMEGNTWLSDTVGVVPKNAWAIDPFGYSPTMAYLLRRMGFENMLIQRTHYELKKELALHQNLEFLWRQSWDIEQTTDIFVHMMPFYSYDVPHTCGPEPAICCQFDFARMPGHGYEACPWRLYPVETNPDNVEERAKKLLDQYRKKSTLYRTNTLLVPLGDDFRYVSVNEAEAQFRNYQMLFDYINTNPSLNAEVKFGTLEDYFQTLRAESERRNFSRPWEMGSRELGGFPTLSGDFFTYADRQKDYWSGYYVSRPFFKAVDRVLEETLRAAEIMMALVLGYCPRASCMKLPVGFALKLTAARRSLALFQHHDGVTGTAKDHVVEDYGLRMHTSLDDLQVFMAKSVDALLNVPQYKIEQPSSVAEYEAEQVRSKFDIQPVHRIIDVPEGSYQSVVFFNPLEQTREEVVMLVVKRPDFCILRSNWSSVNSQVVPELQHDDDNLFTGMHRLFFKVSVPPLGLQTYHVANGYVGCEKPKLSKLRVTTKKDSMHCPAPYMCAKLTDDTVHIRNRLHTLSFNAKRGLLTKVTRHKDAVQTDVQEEIDMYSSVGGAYLFKPTGNAEPIIESGGRLIISEGPLVQEVFSYPKTSRQKSPISHSTRIYNEENTVQEFLIQKEYHVRMVQHDYDDKELITRFKTNIENNRVFYSDLNGFQMIRRETYDKIPVQGNYYPMPSQAFLQDSVGHRFSVHTRQSLGVASLKNGWLEVMLDRRLTRDDERGLGQGVLDNRPMNVLFHLLLETNVSSSDSLPLNPSLLSHLVGDHLNYPMHAFIHKKLEEISSQSPSKSFSPLSASLPCDIHIVNFKAPRPLTASQITPGEPRFVLILQRRGWDTSYCKKGGIDCSTSTDGLFDIFSMFKDLSVLSVRPTSLNILHDDIEQIGNIDEPVRKQLREVEDDKYVMLHPMELQAFKLEVKPNQ